MKKSFIIFLVIGVLAAVGIFVYQQKIPQPNITDPFAGDTSWANPPQGGATTQELPPPPLSPTISKAGNGLALDLPALDVKDIKPTATGKEQVTKQGTPESPVADKPNKTSKPTQIVLEKPTDSVDRVAELRKEVAALAKVVLKQGELLSSLEKQLQSTQIQNEQKLPQYSNPIKKQNLGRLVELTPTEVKSVLKDLPNIPETIVPKQYGVTVEACHEAIQQGTIDAVIQSFLLLSAQGKEVYLTVGNPAPRDRPIWLEVHGDKSITLLANNLPLDAYKNIQSRAALPQLLQLPAYLLTFKDKHLVIYRACEDFKLQTY